MNAKTAFSQFSVCGAAMLTTPPHPPPHPRHRRVIYTAFGGGLCPRALNVSPCMDALMCLLAKKAGRCTGSYLNQGPDDPGLPEMPSVHSPRAEVCTFSEMRAPTPRARRRRLRECLRM